MLLPHHHARRRLASLLSYAGDFTDLSGEVSFGAQTFDPANAPTIGDLDFCLRVRARRTDNRSGYWIMANTAATLDGFGIYQNAGAWVAYANSPQNSIFTPISSAAAAPANQWAELEFSRTGTVMVGKLNGAQAFAIDKGTFTLDPFTNLNVGYRGGGGGGGQASTYVDFLTLDIATGPGGTLERWIDYQFNEADNTPALNAGRAGGQLQANSNRPGFTHVLA